MNNNTQEDYCSFEVSSLLKESGAKLQTHYNGRYHLWWYNGELHTYEWFNSFNNMVSAPTHALAIKWIRDNFNLILVALPYTNADNLSEFSWIWMIHKIKSSTQDNIFFDSPGEAIEAGLLYTLKNLIPNGYKT